ncbi:MULTISPECIES: hypothetical protein [Mesorhizobium]|uniref:hypothetical protein n=1 Tax=Mesorhizobium TaxID=68287 RepID=UPI000AF35896|nr:MULTISPECIES: hypothetical protein [Mesorhizobium]MDF3208402.1 hypothetical protein [Mesorhizobium sp. LMG15046]MDF3229027.1 hypothetical protein [Mesorhizobium sp. DSM 30133]RUU22143.1 hypothetical protein EOC84_03265 [Mesorhizobium sp. Primo-B]RUU37947.1 hypothetical protein EOC83_16950 [Mesorhizobium sp. Primo-A]RVB63176.1 hypothetical protein EN895_18450 [Mesorhizobium sp. M7A.F.Ca.CA.002.03.2.1]
MADLLKLDVAGVEDWREYDFGGRVYRIESPKTVQFRPGGETHRVTDSVGVVHCVPAPGVNGCVLRWSGPVVA